MKISNLLFLLFFTCAFCNAQFAKPNTKNIFKHIVKLNTLRLVNGYYDVQYENFIAKRVSIRGGFGIGDYVKKRGKRASKDFGKEFGKTSIYDNKEHILKSYAINADYRYYILNDIPAPKGLYLAGGLEFRRIKDIFNYSLKTATQAVSNKIESYITNYSLFNLKALFGYQFIIADKIIINPYTGGGYTLGKSRSKDLPIRVNLDIGLSVGIGF